MTALEQTRRDISNHLAEIAGYFQPGVRLTIVARHPALPGDTGLLLTDDDLDAVIAEIQHLRANDRRVTVVPADQSEGAD